MKRFLLVLGLVLMFCTPALADEVFISGKIYDNGQGGIFGMAFPAGNFRTEVFIDGNSITVDGLYYWWHVYGLNVGLINFDNIRPYAGIMLLDKNIVIPETRKKIDSRQKATMNLGIDASVPLLTRVSINSGFSVFPYFEGVGLRYSAKLAVYIKDGATANIGYSGWDFNGRQEYDGLEFGLHFTY